MSDFKRFLSLALLLLAIVTILTSLHNIDLVFNMDSSCFDENFYGIIQNRTQIYKGGIACLFISVILIVIAILIQNLD